MLSALLLHVTLHVIECDCTSLCDADLSLAVGSSITLVTWCPGACFNANFTDGGYLQTDDPLIMCHVSFN